MLVLLTKRKLRPDGFQTVKPPGILAMPNIFSPPFFFRKLLRQVRDFLRIPRMCACSQTNIPNPLKFILEILFPAVLLCQVTLSHSFFPLSHSRLPFPSPIRAQAHSLQTLLHWAASEAAGEGLTLTTGCSTTSAATSTVWVGRGALIASGIQQGKCAILDAQPVACQLMPCWFEGQIQTEAVVGAVTVWVGTDVIVDWGYNSAHTAHSLFWVAGVRLS